MTTDRREALHETLLERIRDETRQAVLEGDAQDCASADCIADAVYEIVRAALAADPPALDVERLEKAIKRVVPQFIGPSQRLADDLITEYARLAHEETP